MANGNVIGGLVGGFASGYAQGQELEHKRKREEREAEEHKLNKKIKELGIGRMEKEQPILDKELQVRGATADYNLNEQKFRNTMQAFEQETRKLLEENKRSQATMDSTRLQAGQQNLPDELRVAREKLNAEVLESTKRSTANIWHVLKLGDHDRAVKMYNDSAVVLPGDKAKGFTIEEVDVPASGDQPARKAQFLVVEPESKGGKVRRIPITVLEQLEQQYGAKYEKAGNNIVRINRDGTTTPVYEAEAYGHTPDGDIYSKRTGEVRNPAAAGIGGAGPGPAPRPSSGAAKRLDERVKMAIDKVILPRFGGRFEGGMFFPDEANKEVALRATELAGGYVRGGMDPEAAGKKAVDEALREKALKDQTKPKPGSGGYGGPTPWKK